MKLLADLRKRWDERIKALKKVQKYVKGVYFVSDDSYRLTYMADKGIKDGGSTFASKWIHSVGPLPSLPSKDCFVF